MFFSLTARGPASRTRPSSATATPARAGAHARPPRRAGPQGGREEGGGRGSGGVAWHCPALCHPATPPRRSPAPPPAPPMAHSGPAAQCPPCAHPGCPHLPGAWVRLAPGAPGHVLGAASARPTSLPALGGEPGTGPAAGSPARAGEPSGEGVCGEGCGPRRCPRRERPRCPAAPRPRPGPSPEAHKGTDNTGGLVKTVMCGSRRTNKSPYLFI